MRKAVVTAQLLSKADEIEAMAGDWGGRPTFELPKAAAQEAAAILRDAAGELLQPRERLGV